MYEHNVTVHALKTLPIEIDCATLKDPHLFMQSALSMRERNGIGDAEIQACPYPGGYSTGPRLVINHDSD